MDNPIAPFSLYCTVERNKKCNDEGRRSKAQRVEIKTYPVRSWLGIYAT